MDILNDRLCFPADASVNGIKIPYYFVADDAFPLCKRIMKPYSKKTFTEEETVFNYRLSRARRCVENAFGILCSKWACLKKTLYCYPDRAQKIITACCHLHNYLISNHSRAYCSPQDTDRLDAEGRLIEGNWRRRMACSTDSLYHSHLETRTGRNSDYGKYIRNIIKNYVTSTVGLLPWQGRAAFIE